VTRSQFPVDGNVKFEVVELGTALRATGDLAIKTAFLSVAKLEKLPFKVKNTARFGQAPDVEMSLMLDVTGSMDGKKIKDLKDAVQDLIDIVIKEDDSSSISRIALAPFSSSVKLKNAM